MSVKDEFYIMRDRQFHDVKMKNKQTADPFSPLFFSDHLRNEGSLYLSTYFLRNFTQCKTKQILPGFIQKGNFLFKDQLVGKRHCDQVIK